MVLKLNQVVILLFQVKGPIGKFSILNLFSKVAGSHGNLSFLPAFFFPFPLSLFSFLPFPGSQFAAQVGLELILFLSKQRLQVSYEARCTTMSLNKLKKETWSFVWALSSSWGLKSYGMETFRLPGHSFASLCWLEAVVAW